MFVYILAWSLLNISLLAGHTAENEDEEEEEEKEKSDTEEEDDRDRVKDNCYGLENDP